ncbi:WD40 repeat-like protein [Lactarius akahatsu]|uniref:WD40 repeat-like protein n=1 Tax=Lactarius akahatsu TaxID=416441 RepID=A0AAD4LMN0_9AGAM|nr:WD40 repeat-like protein [Lactarius akahatsu]
MTSSYSPEYGDFDIGGILRPSGEQDTRREQTLSRLLDALDQIGKRHQIDSAVQHSDITDDGASGHAAVDAFTRFQRRVNDFDKELRTCVNLARQLGSSVAILSSIFQLRDRLAQISFLFRENAADLYPRKIFRLPRESLVSRSRMPKRRLEKLRRSTNVRRRLPFDKLDVEDFPEQLDLFSRALSKFLYNLNEFPEFTDKSVDAPIMAFEGDLKYWASCLLTFGGELKSPPIQRYIMELMSDMGEHFESVSAALSMFNEVGIPTIRFAQHHGASNFLNLSTIATFFSAVTATTIQFSYQNVGTALADAVNAFWFTSMVFSIAAAVNSLLGLTWKQSAYRSPSHQVPWWVLLWLKRTPLVFLVLSVACFSIGLVLFAYSSGQSSFVSAITTLFTALSSFGLATVSTWFALERWVSNKHKGSKWLSDFFDDIWKLVRPVLSFHQVFYIAHRIKLSLTRAKEWVLQRFERPVRAPGQTSSWNSLDHTASPQYANVSPRHAAPSDQTSDTTSSQSDPMADCPIATSDLQPRPATVVVSPRRARFAQALRTMMEKQAAGAFTRQNPTMARPAPAESRQEELRGLLTILLRTKPLFLATSSYDQTSVLFSIGTSTPHHRTLTHSEPVGQIAWSPSGSLLLTKFRHSVKVWTEAGKCRQEIDRKLPIQSICWLPGGEAFMSVEGQNVHKLDITGQDLDTYYFERLKIQEVCVTPDGQRLIGYGVSTASRDGLRPHKCRAEKLFFVYNLDTKRLEDRIPVLHNIRHIALTQSGQSVLLSYESKAAPQLWKLSLTSEWEKVDAPVTTRLLLRHTYVSKPPMESPGPSYFGGKNDELVLCAGKAGDIHIWDRESASFLLHIRAPAIGGGLTCVAWNQAANPFMFATGSHDGTVQFWTSSPRDVTENAALSGLQASRSFIEKASSMAGPDRTSWVSQKPIVPSMGEEDEKGSYDGDDGGDYSGKEKDTEEFSSNGDGQSFRSVVSQMPTLLYDAAPV